MALTEEASPAVENAPLLLLRISQCAFPGLPSPLGLANGGNPVVGLPRPNPSYFASLRTVGLSPSSRSTSVSLSLALAAALGFCRSFFVDFASFGRLRPGKAAGRLFRGLPLPFPTPGPGGSSKPLKPILWATALCHGRVTPPTRCAVLTFLTGVPGTRLGSASL